LLISSASSSSSSKYFTPNLLEDEEDYELGVGAKGEGRRLCGRAPQREAVAKRQPPHVVLTLAADKAAFNATEY